jgi:hypothetical protein
MITPATQSKLSLLLPQQNKVLNELIKNATPEQLVSLNDKKDLKSMLGTLFQHKIDNTKSDALLLNMLKNSPAFKNMGNFTDTLKSLVTDLKSNPAFENSANKLLRAATHLQPDTIGQKVMTTLESTPTKTNPQANSLLKPEILTQGDKNIPNAITPEIRTSLIPLDTLEAKTTQFDQNLPLQTKESSTVSDHEEAVHSPIFELDAPILKEKIINSGVFMESKIATLEGATQEIVDEQMSNDLKSQLLELHEELQTSPSHENRQLQFKVDELLTHIDYHQLLSHLNNSNSLYFPFAWEGLEKGSIELKKSKGEKFYCEINLTLKEHGNVDLFMGLHDENQLEIKIHTQKTQFKELLQTHIDELRTLLRDANLTLRSVRIFDENERLTQSLKAYESINDDTSDGFEVTI